MVSKTFNRESNDPVNEEPILMGTREHGGTTQYIVHQYNGFWSANLPGGEDKDDIKYYSEEEYQEKFGDNAPRSFDDLKEDYSSIVDKRYDVLQEAKSHIESHSKYEVADNGKELDALNRMQKHVNEIAGIMVRDGPNNEVAQKALKLGNDALDLGYQAKEIRERIQSIGEDLENNGEPLPKMMAELHHN